MKYEKELELSGMTPFSDEPVWTVEKLGKHLAWECPKGWLVESFRVTLVPGSKRAAVEPVEPATPGPTTKKKLKEKV